MKKTLLSFLPLVCMVAFTLVSCGSDHDDGDEDRIYEVSYTVTTGGVQGFTTDEANVHMEVMNMFQNAVDEANGGKTATLTSATAHDSRVMAACYTTQDKVETDYLNFRGTLYVTNSATRKTIYTITKR